MDIIFPTNAECSNYKGLVTLKIRFTQRVQIPPFSQAMVTVQSEQAGQILLAPKFPTAKRMECSAARGIQDVNRNVPFK